MTELSYLRIDTLPSTNTYVKEHASELASGTVVYTPRQTAGRGWATNRWESEPGKNLSFTLLYKPRALKARRQWAVSACTAVAIVTYLQKVTGIKKEFTIKWPNDIYYCDRKVAGILIENSIVDDRLLHCTIGIGLNVNQTVFLSDAPNPASLAQITGKELDLDALLKGLNKSIVESIENVDQEGEGSEDWEQHYTDLFKYLLYRNVGSHEWQTPDGEHFVAKIVDVDKDGNLVLRHEDGTRHTYGFKQVKHVINPQLSI